MRRTGSESDEQRYPPGFAEALGRTIKVLRTDRGLERRELAEQVGISYSYLTEIENGNKPPSSSVLSPIAAAFGLRMSQLIEAAEVRMDTLAPPESKLSLADVAEREIQPARYYAMMPALRGPEREMRAALAELERLLSAMAPDDIERLLDFARRLAR